MTRPLFVPTDDERSLVGKLSGFGLPVEMIARLIRTGIAEKTLRRAFKKELADGKARASAKILATLYQKAIGGDTVSMLFWIKCRIPGWREIQRTELTGADGAPLAQPQTGVLLVPMPPSIEAWEELVAKQQAALAKLTAKPKDTLQ